MKFSIVSVRPTQEAIRRKGYTSTYYVPFVERDDAKRYIVNSALSYLPDEEWVQGEEGPGQLIVGHVEVWRNRYDNGGLTRQQRELWEVLQNDSLTLTHKMLAARKYMADKWETLYMVHTFEAPYASIEEAYPWREPENVWKG